MSNAKLPAPTDRCELCEETYKDHSPGDHKYCPERDVIERGQGWFFSYDPKKVFTPKAGAEATGKSDRSDNELINTFMGLKSRVVRSGDYPFTVWYRDDPYNWFSPPEYDKDWNALMPVVEKIESLKSYVSINGNKCDVYNYFDITEVIRGNGPEISKYKNRHSAPTKIEATYKAVVDFIKWYNSNKKA